ncbi:MAG: transaldolase family protein [Kiritimatiellia bacterium]
MHALTDPDSDYSRRAREFVRQDFAPHFQKTQPVSRAGSLWERLNALRTELWLDSGDISLIEPLWSREFSALTTNNTLLNQEVRKGTYDPFVREAAAFLDPFPDLNRQDRKLELAFLLNARHGLKLVETFDAHVSVELHTDLAGDLDGTLRYARRLHAVCPERFYVKIPFTAAGLLAARRLARENIPINQTLAFSARQNYAIGWLARPKFSNVFLGRVGAFVAENGLGSGAFAGERATLAAQAAIHKLREQAGIPTRLIAASFRAGAQVRDLAGVDVMTLPPKVAEEFLGLGLREDDLSDRSRELYDPVLNVNPGPFGLNGLWERDESLETAFLQLEQEKLDAFSPQDLAGFLAQNGCADLLVNWSEAEVALSRKEGKIPRLANWRDPLEERQPAVDSLLNLAGLNSFRVDQDEMDRHAAELLSTAGVR